MRAPDLLRTLTLLAGALAACAVTGGARAAKPDPEKLAPSVVRDLHYGDVLFYFYQDKNLDAITRLLAFEQWQRLPNSEAESKLLLAGLYLELGLNNEAGTRFEQLLTPEVPVGVRNRAWFYLGKVWYARGYLDRAEHAIREITAALPPALEAEKVSLLANILLRQSRFDEAVALLKGWHGPPDWMAFAEFNLGVALAREGRLAEADPLLTGVGTLATRRSELLALKDRANLALGFAYLQADRPAEAKSALERVRLRGPYSNKALLGTGWAYIALGDYQAALRPLLELHDRNLLDAAVQESYLAVPYAYAKLDSTAQAADAYESAIRAFDEESARLDAGIAKLRSGHLLDDLLANEAETGKYGWYWQLKALPDAVESRYLYSVLASHDFQEGLKNYRDLAALDGTLARWSDNMVAFADMIDTREKAYAERIPRTDALLASGAIDRLEAERTALESRLNGVEAAGDFAALGSPEERDQWRRVLRIEEGLASAGATADPQLREKARLLKGVLYWRLNETWRARVWQERRSLKEIDVALREARNLWVRVQHDRSGTVADTGGFANRLGSLKTRLEALRGRLAATRAKQNDYLAGLAARELEAEKGRLATYQIQARFALAAIYDRGSSPPPKPATGAAGAKP
jgi:lipopolysaccharide biosynthesis regulator YciM